MSAFMLWIAYCAKCRQWGIKPKNFAEFTKS